MTKKSLILIGHGSKMPFMAKTIRGLAGNIAKKGVWDKVSYCFLQMNEPSIESALEVVCRDKEMVTVVLVPVFISHGAHTLYDIPAMLGMEKGCRSSIRDLNGRERALILADPIGSDPLLSDIIDNLGTLALEDGHNL